MATSARNWKRPDEFDVELPSGNTALLRRPGMEKLLSAGILPDSLTPMAIEAVQKAQGGPKKPQDRKAKKGDESNELDPEIMQKFLEKEGALEDIFMSFDKVTAMCVVEPKVKLHLVQLLDNDGIPKKDVNGRDIWREIPEDEREPLEDRDFLYTDEVDSEDKQFIFQFASGGSTDLTPFRNPGTSVADSQSGSDVPVPTLGDTGD